MPFRRFLAPRSASALALAAALAGGACAKSAGDATWTEGRLASLSLRARAGQMVVAAVDLDAASDSAVRAMARATGAGGILVTRGDGARLRALADSLRHAPLPVLVAADGAMAGLRGAASLPPPWALGAARADSGAARAADAGALAAADARTAGVHLLVLDGPPLDRDASLALADPRAPAAGEARLAHAGALREAGLLVAFRAFPASADSAPPVLRWDRAAVEALQLRFLRRAGALPADALVVEPTVLPAVTGDSVPLPLSPVAIGGVLRRDLGFAGLVAVDVSRGGMLARGDAVEAGVRSVAAGADLLLGVEDPRAMVDALVAAVERGRIPRARVDAAVRRVFAAKRAAGLRLPRPGDTAAAVPRPAAAERAARAEAVAALHREAAVRGGRPAAAWRACRAPMLVAPEAPRVPVFLAGVNAGRRAPLPVHLGDTVRLRGPLVRGDTASPRPDCILVVRLPGARATVLVDPGVPRPPPPPPAPRQTTRRPARGRQPARPAPPRDTVQPRDTVRRRVVEVSFGVTAAPPLAPDAEVLVWGTSPPAQEAAAAALAGRAEPAAPARLAWPPAAPLREVRAAAVGMDSTRLLRVDSVLRAAVRDGVFPGAAVAIGRRGGLVRLRGYGTTGGGAASTPVDAKETLYDIASLTKVVGTTAAVMALTEDGAMELGAPLRRYVPEFRGGRKGEVTVRQLMTHTGGLPAGAWLYSSRSAEAALDRVHRAELRTAPGARTEYSDFGMILMAEAASRRAKEPLDEYLAHRVFGPLGMSSTLYVPPRHLQPVTAVAALRSERPYALRGVVHDANAFRLGGTAGHAGLFSTARDLAVYAQTLLRGGAYGPLRVYRPATVQRFTTPVRAGSRAPGWDVAGPNSSAGAYFSARTFGHTGYTGTSIWIDPQRDLFVVLLTNRTYDEGTSGQIHRVRQAVANAAALAITDGPVTMRPGAATPAEAWARPPAPPRRTPARAPRRPTRRPAGRRGD